jgi:enoyl-CoA hydratase/carnithine racemase
MMKKSIYAGLDWDPRTAAWREAFAQAATVDTADAKEGVAALLEKRPPVFHGR